MKLSSDFAGTVLKSYNCRISARRIMNYAAAVGDANPLYFDDERPEGIIAPPLFPVAITWPIIQNIADYITENEFPREILLSQVHYSEHLCIHRPVRPERDIKIEGKIAAVLPHRAGTHVVLRFTARDDGGSALFVEHVGALMRNVECSDGGRGGADIPAFPVCTENSAVCWESNLTVDPLAPFLYDGCTGIHFPIHTSVAFAHAVGLPGIIVQGTNTLAMAVHTILRREQDGDPRRLKEVFCRFTGMVLPGSKILVNVNSVKKTASKGEIFFTVYNNEGKRAISDGCIKLAEEGRLP